MGMQYKSCLCAVLVMVVFMVPGTVFAERAALPLAQVQRHLQTILIPNQKTVKVSKRKLKRKIRARNRGKILRRSAGYQLASFTSGSGSFNREKNRSYSCGSGSGGAGQSGSIDHSFTASLVIEGDTVSYQRDGEALFNDCNGFSGNLDVSIEALARKVAAGGANTYSFESSSSVDGTGEAHCIVSNVEVPGTLDVSLEVSNNGFVGAGNRLLSGRIALACELQGQSVTLVSCEWDAVSLRDKAAILEGCNSSL